MKLSSIRNMPYQFPGLQKDVGFQINHESLLRSYHILNKVIELCEKKCPHDIIIEIIEDLKEEIQR